MLVYDMYGWPRAGPARSLAIISEVPIGWIITAQAAILGAFVFLKLERKQSGA